MTLAEIIICRIYLNDLDETHSCNEYKLLMRLLDQEKKKAEDELKKECERPSEGAFLERLKNKGMTI